jgi:hypothetical protein
MALINRGLTGNSLPMAAITGTASTAQRLRMGFSAEFADLRGFVSNRIC